MVLAPISQCLASALHDLILDFVLDCGSVGLASLLGLSPVNTVDFGLTALLRTVEPTCQSSAFEGFQASATATSPAALPTTTPHSGLG